MKVDALREALVADGDQGGAGTEDTRLDLQDAQQIDSADSELRLHLFERALVLRHGLLQVLLALREEVFVGERVFDLLESVEEGLPVGGDGGLLVGRRDVDLTFEKPSGVERRKHPRAELADRASK